VILWGEAERFDCSREPAHATYMRMRSPSGRARRTAGTGLAERRSDVCCVIPVGERRMSPYQHARLWSEPLDRSRESAHAIRAPGRAWRGHGGHGASAYGGVRYAV
jgi:hypothetical protein